MQRLQIAGGSAIYLDKEGGTTMEENRRCAPEDVSGVDIQDVLATSSANWRDEIEQEGPINLISSSGVHISDGEALAGDRSVISRQGGKSFDTGNRFTVGESGLTKSCVYLNQSGD